MGASAGSFGTVRAQTHLRQVCAYNDMHGVNGPQVLVADAPDKLDQQRRLTDETSLQFVQEQLQSRPRCAASPFIWSTIKAAHASSSCATSATMTPR